MYGKYEYFVRTAVPGTWYIPGVRVPGRWYSYVVQSIILVVTPVSFSIMSGNIIRFFSFIFRNNVLYISSQRGICFPPTGRIPGVK